MSVPGPRLRDTAGGMKPVPAISLHRPTPTLGPHPPRGAPACCAPATPGTSRRGWGGGPAFAELGLTRLHCQALMQVDAPSTHIFFLTPACRGFSLPPPLLTPACRGCSLLPPHSQASRVSLSFACCWWAAGMTSGGAEALGAASPGEGGPAVLGSWHRTWRAGHSMVCLADGGGEAPGLWREGRAKSRQSLAPLLLPRLVSRPVLPQGVRPREGCHPEPRPPAASSIPLTHTRIPRGQ